MTSPEMSKVRTERAGRGPKSKIVVEAEFEHYFKLLVHDFLLLA
jgi:hypothetical protein